MDQETVIERGLAAASLLNDPTFRDVLRSLTVECFAVFTETKPDELNKREDTYNLHRGLQAIEAELNARVHAKELAVQKLDADLDIPSEVEGPIYMQGNTDQ